MKPPLLLAALTLSLPADTAFDAHGNFNPLVPGYFADPTIEKFGETYHLYATTDGTLFHFRTSPDGDRWTDLPGSPVERPDLEGLPLQVGL